MASAPGYSHASYEKSSVKPRLGDIYNNEKCFIKGSRLQKKGKMEELSRTGGDSEDAKSSRGPWTGPWSRNTSLIEKSVKSEHALNINRIVPRWVSKFGSWPNDDTGCWCEGKLSKGVWNPSFFFGDLSKFLSERNSKQDCRWWSGEGRRKGGRVYKASINERQGIRERLDSAGIHPSDEAMSWAVRLGGQRGLHLGHAEYEVILGHPGGHPAWAAWGTCLESERENWEYKLQSS